MVRAKADIPALRICAENRLDLVLRFTFRIWRAHCGRPWAAGGDGCPFPSRDHRLRLLDVQAAAIC